MERVYLGVGSNLGNRQHYLDAARKLTEEIPRTRFLKSSSVIETDPVGGPPQGKYLNAVWEIETTLAPRELKNHLLKIEAQLGRKRNAKNTPREIDLDILFYGDRVIEEKDLKIPHPRLQERFFVLIPLNEIASDKVHPGLKKSVKEIYENCA